MPDSRTSIDSLLASKATPHKSHQQDPAQDDGYQAFNYGRIGRHAQMMVAFVRASGALEAYPYSMLSRLESNHPADGCRLWFGPVAVTLEGKDLSKLCRYLREHRVLEVHEASHEQRFTTEGEGLVTRIGIATETASLR